ncbi:hypothetical protein [Micromonospora chokoriensis]|uniref:hypothetical protein n=1 Tax=Micromonospora chokoriensis TaxID=356851 RepID=UPI0012FD378C|nr:hypothetical protein [Micromonospora chokoriensis]
MTGDPLRGLPVEVAARRPPLDYYLVLPRPGRTESTGVVAEGIVVEEFTRHHDFSTAGLASPSDASTVSCSPRTSGTTRWQISGRPVDSRPRHRSACVGFGRSRSPGAGR